MKILQVTPSFLPRPGGIGRYVYNLSEALRLSGHEIDIAATDIPKRFHDEGDNHHFISSLIHAEIKQTNYENYSVDLYPCIGEPLGNPIGFKFKFLKRNLEKYDAVHLHGVYFYPTLRIAMMLRKSEKKLVITHHGRIVYSNSLKQLLVRIYEKTCVRYILFKADNIVALSDSDKEHLSAIAHVSDKISVIPNGINVNNFVKPDSAIIERFKLKYGLENKKIILFVSVITTRKGIFDLLSAFSMIEYNPNLTLLIVGIGPELELAKKKASEFNTSDNIIFTEKVSFDELLAAYSIADVYVLPSYFEGMPTTLLEAIAMGAPSIGSDIPGVSDYFSNYIPLIRPGDIVQLRDNMLELLLNPPSKDKLNTMADYIRDSYNSEITFKKYNQIYYLNNQGRL